MEELEQVLKSDVLVIVGDLVGGVDDVIKNVIEQKRQESKKYEKLTILLTTNGGFIEVVHRIVDALRFHYKNGVIDFIIPNYAFSAGTVFAMSGDAIFMNYYSRLGPIDPQYETSEGRTVPALGYLKQYERLLEKAKDGSITLPEIQVMLSFDQAELYKYEQARELSISLLKDWLVKYKFKNWTKTKSRGKTVTSPMKEKRAAEIAKKLNDTDKWHTHGYGISMEVLRQDLNVEIDDFSINQQLNDKIKEYTALLDDYMSKMMQGGVVHTVRNYQVFHEHSH